MEIVIITGMSGAGKSQASNVLEDIGYYCVDNIPPYLIPTFINLIKQVDNINKICFVVDIRASNFIGGFIKCLDNLKSNGIEYKLLFLEASYDTLLSRYKESRRTHPLSSTNSISLEDAIQDEIVIMQPISEIADFHIDTTQISISQLKSIVLDSFLEDASSAMVIRCLSFGFKLGVPPESDLLLDVRCLPNPFYIPQLKEKTGLDKEVRDYVFSFDETKTLLEKFYGLIDYLLPMYKAEGKSQLVIAIGCTGGRHRSTAICEEINKHIQSLGYNSNAVHRDVGKHL